MIDQAVVDCAQQELRESQARIAELERQLAIETTRRSDLRAFIELYPHYQKLVDGQPEEAEEGPS